MLPSFTSFAIVRIYAMAVIPLLGAAIAIYGQN
jgi:hypothetical protein